MTDLKYIAIEIGGTKLQAALGTAEGEILECERADAPADEGADAILAWFKKSIPRLIAHSDGEIGAFGVGFGGPVDANEGRVLVSHQVEGWSGFPLSQWFTEHFGYAAEVENDANAAGWGEYCNGAGRGTRNFCYMNIGSGIGGAFVIDGKLFNGQGFGGAEIGHTWVPDFTSNTPGATDKLEHLCSGWAIEKRMRAQSLDTGSPLHQLCQGDAQSITAPMVAEAARQGDTAALAELDRVAATLAIALGNVITLTHPERIALGGGVSLMGDVLIDPLKEHLKERAFHLYEDTYELTLCQLEESVVLVGALRLAAQRVA